MTAATHELQAVMTRLEDLHTQQVTLQQRATALQHFIDTGRTLLGDTPSPEGPDEIQASIAPAMAPTPREPTPQKLTIALATKLLLETTGHPLAVEAITEALRAQGYLQGQYPLAGLRAMLMKNRRLFTRTPDGHSALTTWRHTPPAPPERHDRGMTAAQAPETDPEHTEEAPHAP